MTADIRPDGRLPEILEELYLGRVPDYRDEVVAGAVRHRQRPAWTFPGRWIPMADIASRPAFAASLPWRAIGLALVLIALLAAAAVAISGANQSRVPAPFGLARNGAIAWYADGDIYSADPVTGITTAIVTGTQEDVDPVFSPDGTRLAFGRFVEGDDPPRMDIVVADADGTHPQVITTEPIPVDDVRFEWAPDSRSLIVDAPDETGIWRYDATTKAPRTVVATETSFYLRPFQPPDGQQLLIERHEGALSRLIALNLVTGVETLLAEGAGDELGSARWSADGSKVVYHASPDDGVSERLYLVNADGTGTTQITHAPGVWYDIDAKYSPDGTKIAFTRYERLKSNVWVVRPTGIYDVATGEVTEVGPLAREVREQLPSEDDARASEGEGLFHEWSPDGTALLAFESEGGGHPIVIDVGTGTWHALDRISASGAPTQQWQRQAP
jgi:Tol biopolymer transport system component